MINGRKLVVVTGTSGGLGSAISKRLIGSGFFVVGISRRPVEFRETVQQSNGEYQHIIWDLSRIEALKELSDTIVRTIGTPFGLINNAAIGTDGILPTMHNSEIQNLMTVNVVSPIVLTKYLVRPMLSVREGRIINISSIVAGSGYRGLAAYGATKAAIEGFTRSFSRDVGPRSITVNAVAPGFIVSDMTNKLNDAQKEAILSKIPTKTLGSPDDVANAVAFIASDMASYITGQTIHVNGGLLMV